MVLSSHPPLGSVVLQGMPSQTNNVVLSNHQPSECVLLSPNMGSAGQGLVLQGQPGVGGVVLSGHHQPGQVVLAPATGQPLLIAGLSGGKLILTPSPQHSPVSHRPAPSPTSAAVTLDTDPVNLSITKPPHPNQPSPSSHSPAHGKRPAPPMDLDDEDIRRSSRVGRGKIYQEFIEDGRLSVGSRKRRSHRSGEEFSESEVEPDPLPQGTDSQEAEILDNNPSSELVNSQMNHWKKKMRTASLGENTQSDLMAARPPDIHTATNTAKSQFDLDAKMGAMEPLSLEQFQKKREERESKLKNRSSGSSRSTRQSQPEKAPSTSKAFDARMGNRKGRGEKI